MGFIEKVYNDDNLRDDEINERSIRARAILINSNDEVLMCYSNGLMHYEFPGGHLEEGESLEECLQREIWEETGITIDTKEAEPFYSIKYYCKNYHGENINKLFVIDYYIVHCDTLFDNNNRQLDENEIVEEYECRYIKVDELMDALLESKRTTKEENAVADDMILVWSAFLEQRKKHSI